MFQALIRASADLTDDDDERIVYRNETASIKAETLEQIIALTMQLWTPEQIKKIEIWRA